MSSISISSERHRALQNLPIPLPKLMTNGAAGLRKTTDCAAAKQFIRARAVEKRRIFEPVSKSYPIFDGRTEIFPMSHTATRLLAFRDARREGQ